MSVFVLKPIICSLQYHNDTFEKTLMWLYLMQVKNITVMFTYVCVYCISLKFVK